jgi:hypothetical protein
MGEILGPILNYIAQIGGDVGEFLANLFGGGGEAALGGGLADAYGPGAASFLGDVEGGLGDSGSAFGSAIGGGDFLGGGSLDYGGGITDVAALGDTPWDLPAYDVGYGPTAGSTVSDYYVNPQAVGGDVGGDIWTPDMAYGAMGGSTGNAMEDWQIANPNNVSTSDMLRSRVMETSPAGSEPFHGLTVDPYSSIPSSTNVPDWLKTAGQMASNFLKGAASGLGGGAGGGADPFSLAMAGRGVPAVGPAGAPNYLGVGAVPSGATPPMQLASMGALAAAPGQPGEQTVGGNPLAQAMGIPQAANLAGQPVGSPNTFGAPTPRNLNPFSPMMIPLPQAPLYPGIQNQPMSGLQRLMMAG